MLLDELAWWLGALVMKQGGLPNRLTVSLHVPDAPFDGTLVAAGRFADVTPVDRKRTFWRTESTLRTASGALMASASIVFRGGPDYSERQIPSFKPRTPPEIFRRAPFASQHLAGLAQGERNHLAAGVAPKGAGPPVRSASTASPPWNQVKV